MKIGWIGLGNIGGPAALHLVEAGHKVKVHDLSEEAATKHVEMGAQWVDSPEAAARHSDLIFTSLPFPCDVETVVLGKKGILRGLTPGAIYGDLTTNRLTLTRRLYEVLMKVEASMLDMPISGGHNGSMAATMAIWVGGDENIYDRIRPVLQVMGKPMYCGPNGSGNICKLVNNLIGHAIQEVLFEGFTVGVKAGVPLGTLIKALSMAGLRKPILQNLRFTDDHKNGSRLDLASASVQLACELARDLLVPAEVSAVVEQRYNEALSKGWGHLSPGAIQKVFEARSGVELRGP